MLYQPTWLNSRIWAVMSLMTYINLFSWKHELVEEARSISRVWGRNGFEV